MKAIIFAAGQSKRLGHLTHDLPKSCLNLFNNFTVLDFSLKGIHDSGFTELLIVSGHKNEKIENLVNKNWKNKFEKIDFVFNEDFANKNNIYTAHLIRDLIDDETFIFNSDIVYDHDILKNAVKFFKKESKSFLVVDDSKPLLDEDMKIRLKAGRIVKIHKEQENEICSGEYIGILHLRGKDIKVFKKSLERMIENNETDKYYEDALDTALDDLNLSIVSTKGLSWAEIDTPEDYERAKGLECIKSLYQSI